MYFQSLLALYTSAGVRKTQKVERESFALISFLSALVSVSTKLDKPCLILVHREGEFPHAFFELASETLSVPSILESNDEVSSPGEFHPEALSELYMNLSAHTAPTMEPRRTPICQ